MLVVFKLKLNKDTKKKVINRSKTYMPARKVFKNLLLKLYLFDIPAFRF